MAHDQDGCHKCVDQTTEAIIAMGKGLGQSPIVTLHASAVITPGGVLLFPGHGRTPAFSCADDVVPVGCGSGHTLPCRLSRRADGIIRG